MEGGENLLPNIGKSQFTIYVISYYVNYVTMIVASHHLVSPHSCLLDLLSTDAHLHKYL